MKKINIISGIFLLSLGVVLFASCETTDLNLKDNPNSLSVEKADVDAYLNGIELNFAKNIDDYGRVAMQVTRMTNMGGSTYQNTFSATKFDDEWNHSYTFVLKNIRLMSEKAEAKGLKYHLGIGQVIEAYTVVTLVDLFGDIPYREAVNDNIANPKLDPGAQVYDDALILLDKAIANFSGTSNTTNTFNDFYYNKSWSSWINLANSIKMKIYLQKRLVDPTALAKFDAIVSSGKYIQTSAEDFQFNWSTSVSNPEARSPLFRESYKPSGAGTDYQSNWFMNLMQTDKSKPDPRMKYYFYRQAKEAVKDESNLKCLTQSAPAHYTAGGYVFCTVPGLGYWGRDHADYRGGDPDFAKKTAFGVYPIGGKFDDNSFKQITNNSGAKGAGITPIFLSSTVDFLRAEAALNGGTGNPKTLILSGIQKSFTKVRSFGLKDQTGNAATIPAISLDVQYMTEVGTKFDAATSTEKMEILAKEFFVSLYGNGIDAFNFYRRTGFPHRIQPTLEANPGSFFRSFYYSADEVASNVNITQKSNVTTRVFWDNNPSEGFPVGN
jgi:hypothetical protein